ncbi:hypothetical protein EV359DRAFT_85852 [Lentinula novae-zelandiae]|nr:hypothetical protein EV359DRAFT_85852 [Lentinula novae-zelandiae]
MDGDWPAHDSSHSPQNNEPDVAGFVTDPVFFAHRVASQFQLGDKSRADVVDIAKYINDLPPAMILVSIVNFGAELKTHETLAGIQQEITNLATKVNAVMDTVETKPSLTKGQEDDILKQTKLSVVDPMRTSYENDGIVTDVYAALKKNSDRNSFKSYFSREHATMQHVINKEIRREASYAKSTLQTLLMKTSLVSTTKAAEIIFKSMGNGRISVPETARVLILVFLTFSSKSNWG